MIDSKSSSNYEEKIKYELSQSEALIIDLDGTLVNFERIDHAIIRKIFPDSKVIEIIDKILWKINRLDVFGNGYAGLKVRIFVYSLFSKMTFKECKEEYGLYYEMCLYPELLSVYNSTLKDILSLGYYVIIVTKNVYSKNVLNGIFSQKQKENLDTIVLNNDKKVKFKDLKEKHNSKICIIGNNFFDDIFNSFKIKAPYVYIGKSWCVKLILKAINYISYKLNIQNMYNRGIQITKVEKLKDIFTKEKKRSVSTLFLFALICYIFLFKVMILYLLEVVLQLLFSYAL